MRAASASPRGRELLGRVPFLSGASLGAVVLTLAIVPLFLHVHYQPDVALDVASTSVGIELSDVAVLVVVLAAALALLTGRADLPRAGWPIWAASAFFLALVAAGTLLPLTREAAYAWQDHAVTAFKFGEYALLAVAVPVLIRTAADLRLLLSGFVTWGAVATAVGVLQFLGLVDEFEGRRPGQREPSWLGIHDFAALSAAVLAVTLVAITLGAERRTARRLAAIAGVAGILGVVLSGALAGVIAVALGALACALAGLLRRALTGRQALALAAIVATVAAGVLAMRSADLDELLDILGVATAEQTGNVESYAHREVLLYVGLRIFQDHPVLGAGWQASFEEDVYGRYLDDARARYPGEPELVFPSPEHPWGVQNAFVQTLADLGVVGLGALLAVIAAGLWVAGRSVLRRPPPVSAPALLSVCWLLVVLGVWTGVGLIAGLPVTALFWLALGLAIVSTRELA